MTTEEMKANIQNGIIWLNENRVGWQGEIRQRIKAGKFNMILPCNCIIGTTDGSFWDLFDISEYEHPKAIYLGFSLPFMDDENEAEIEYAKLTQLWIEAINEL